MNGGRRALLWLLVSLLIGVGAARGKTAQPKAQDLFTSGVAALERGAFDEAVDAFELLADQGTVHPDLGFNRAVAYARRAQSQNAHPGDLGRATAALRETLALRPEDDQALRALEAVQAEIAKRRARAGHEPVTARPAIGRAIVGLISEQAWALGALLASFAASAGLALFVFTSHPRRRLTGAVMGWIAGGLLVLSASMAATSRHFRLETEPAVVVVPEARLLTQQATPLDARHETRLIPEGAEVIITEARGQLARVEWGTTEGWVYRSQLRSVAVDAR